MKTVFITIPGDQKREFSHQLKQAVGDLDLIIVQEKPRPSLQARLKTYTRHRRWRDFLAALKLHLRSDIRRALHVFRLRTPKSVPEGWAASTMVVEDINSESVRNQLSKLKPDLLIVWGSTILEHDIVHSATHAINLHFGIAPHYRGAAANQYAVFKNDWERVGATIHYINGIVDAGDVIEQLFADTSLPVRELFTDLNDRAELELARVAGALARGEAVRRSVQDHSLGENFRLRDWTPEKRYRVGSAVLDRLRAE